MHREGAERSFTRGVVWVSAGAMSARAITLISSVVLARLLLPDHFGLFSMAIVVVNAVQMLPDLGLTQALIAHRGDSRRAASVVFLPVMLTATAAALVVCVLAEPIALVMKQPAVVPLLRTLSLNIVVMAAASIPIALLQKAQRWRAQALTEFLPPLVSAVVMVVLAAMGYGAWSIVWGNIARAGTLAVTVWWLSTWRPQLVIDWGVFAEMFRFGKWIILDRVSAFAILNADTAYLARWQGAQVLGYYALPYNWITLPIAQLVSQANRVLFPVLSQVEDAGAQRATLVQACRLLSFLLSPVYFFWLFNAQVFVLALFTSKWLPCVPVLQWLSVYALAHGLAGGILVSFYWATRRPQVAVYAYWVSLGIALGVLAWGRGQWGAVPVAQVFTAAMFVRSAFMIGGLVRLYGMRLSQIWGAVTDGWIAAAAASAIAWWATHVLSLSAIAELVIAVLLHANLYLLVYGWQHHRNPLAYYSRRQWRAVFARYAEEQPLR
ncbi:MAG: lipopolysaccharide biosynthesis protein [Armatimonadota bacterium]|nr:lipopolysaccharide biosynthesis protein [bacterium]MDW8321313.1 lipopolysaccharide biosynthesis protein [Armatimonadota bacterium]